MNKLSENSNTLKYSIEMTSKIHKDNIYIIFWMFGTRLDKFIFIMDLKINLLNVVNYKNTLEKMRNYNLSLDQKAYCLNILFMRYLNFEIIDKKLKNRDKNITKQKIINRGVNTKNKGNTKFSLPIKNCRFHYPFGKDNPPKNRVSFTIRADYNNTKLGIKIKYKSFELNDYGLLNARYYLDTELKKYNGTEKALYFSEEEYNYIKNFGIVKFKNYSKYNSGVDYDKYVKVILNRYLTLDEQYHIEQSYSKNVIILDKGINNDNNRIN